MKKSDLIFSAILVPIDYLMIILAAITAYFLRYESWVQDIRPVIFDLNFSYFMSYVWLIAFGWLVFFVIAGLYQIKTSIKFFSEIGKIFLACSTSMLAVIVSAFFSRELFDSRFILLITWIFAIIFVSIGRIIVRGIQKIFYTNGIGVHKVVVIGKDENTQNIISEIYRNKKIGLKIIANLQNLNNGNLNKLNEIYKNKGIDEIIQADVSFPREENLSLLEFADEHHIVFKYIADFFETKSSNIEMSTLSGVPIVEVKRTKLEGWWQILKRIFDLIISFFLLIVLSPIFLIVALILKIDSRGPVFYSQIRIGTKEKKIVIHKFRSMVVGADKIKSKLLQKNERKDGPLFKIENDPRITRVGKFIRKWSIDELPQIWDVFIGRMSLVGPRPHLSTEVAKYEKRHKKLLNIKPGITGLAQVSGRSNLSFEDEARLDVFYIENWNLWLDLIILIKTPWVVLSRQGAK